uniref:Uncharacterized protein n=1 Tax=Setaria italica TaxID=4555 RepID=K3YXD8_SETIT
MVPFVPSLITYTVIHSWSLEGLVRSTKRIEPHDSFAFGLPFSFSVSFGDCLPGVQLFVCYSGLLLLPANGK